MCRGLLQSLTDRWLRRELAVRCYPEIHIREPEHTDAAVVCGTSSDTNDEVPASVDDSVADQFTYAVGGCI